MATTSSMHGAFSDELTRKAMGAKLINNIQPMNGRELRREAKRRRRREAKQAAKA